MPPITTERLAALLADYVQRAGTTVDLLLVGGLALQAYGAADRVTLDVDGELVGDLDEVVRFLRAHDVPADLGENISGRSVVAMPPGYRERASVLLAQPGLRIRLLHPTDFVIAKLRRGTDLDLDDAEYVARRFGVTTQVVRRAADAALAASPKDTALFLFRKTTPCSAHAWLRADRVWRKPYQQRAPGTDLGYVADWVRARPEFSGEGEWGAGERSRPGHGSGRPGRRGPRQQRA